MKNWYVVYTKPKQEERALINLQQQNFEPLLPKIWTHKRRSGGYQLVQEVMFPRYIFIQIDPGQKSMAKIRYTRGVVDLVKFAYEPARVPNELIETIKSREVASRSTLSNKPSFSPGDKLRVVSGALTGYEGVFKSHSGATRVTMLLDLAFQFTTVQLPLDTVERID